MFLLTLVTFASAKGLSCIYFYNQLSKNHTALSLASIESVENQISSLKNLGSDAETLWALQKQIQNFPKAYQSLVITELLSNYSLLSKDRQHRNAPVAPKRSVDFLISHLMNPLDIFITSQNPMKAYMNYLESFQPFDKEFLQPELILSTIVTLYKDLKKSTLKGDSQFLLFGSFFNGRAKNTSDIDIMEYLDVNGKSRYSKTYNLLKTQNLTDFEISGTYGNIKNIALDKSYSLKTQPLIILLTIHKIHFIIRDENSPDQQRVFTAPIKSLLN